MQNYLVVATSGRAIAQGLKPHCNLLAVVDGFADRDTQTIADEVRKVTRTRFGLDENEVLQAVDELRSQINFNGLFFDSVMETNPHLLANLAVEPKVGNNSFVLQKCKNPKHFFSMLDSYSIPYPETHFQFSKESLSNEDWLLKNIKSTGGIGVSSMWKLTDLSDDFYLQKKISGALFSITFIASDKQLSELGFNTLWTEELDESLPYVYVGAVNQVNLGQETKAKAIEYAKIISKELNLIGLNSIDFIYANDLIYVLEVNPRIPATYELYETKYGELMHDHIQACIQHKLPERKSSPLLRAHGILYAPDNLTIPNNMSWPLWTADRPHDSEVIKQHEPICSVFAGGKNISQASEMIKKRKQTIFAKLLH